MTYAESVDAAKADCDRQREQIFALTGLDLTDDGPRSCKEWCTRCEFVGSGQTPDRAVNALANHYATVHWPGWAEQAGQ